MQSLMIPIILFIGMSLFIMYFALNATKNDAHLRKKLNDILEQSDLDTENYELSKYNIQKLTFQQRVFYPYVQRMSTFLRKFTPKEKLNELDKKMILAGSPQNMTGVDFLGIQGLATLGIPVFFFLLFFIIGAPMGTIIFYCFFGAAVGYVVPTFMLGKKITKRQELIRKNLPFSLDLLTVSVDAGLGFDSAMDKVTQNLDGPISEEFERVLTEIRIGKSRAEALRNMIVRTEVKELSQFVVAIIQADRLGTGLSLLLKVQSKSLRQAAKQRAQEKAFKAPVKMLFPMILFIFPSIFVVLLGPALLTLPELLGAAM